MENGEIPELLEKTSLSFSSPHVSFWGRRTVLAKGRWDGTRRKRLTFSTSISLDNNLLRSRRADFNQKAFNKAKANIKCKSIHLRPFSQTEVEATEFNWLFTISLQRYLHSLVPFTTTLATTVCLLSHVSQASPFIFYVVESCNASRD